MKYMMEILAKGEDVHGQPQALKVQISTDEEPDGDSRAHLRGQTCGFWRREFATWPTGYAEKTLVLRAEPLETTP